MFKFTSICINEPACRCKRLNRPKQVLHLHLHRNVWWHASTLELHSGVMNGPSVSEDMFSHLSMESVSVGTRLLLEQNPL